MLLLLSQDDKLPTYVHFITGGMAGCTAQTVSQPMDVIKVRMQISKTPLSQIIRNTLRDAGIRGFYVGWTAAMLRQLTYTTARLGLYNTLFDFTQGHFGRLNYPTMIGIGMISGIVGSFIGTPNDLVLIRMISDIKLPPNERRNYRNAIVGLIDIWRTEGVTGLWRGAVPTMTRAAIVNGAQLGTYSKSKMLLNDTGFFEEGILLSFMAAMISGLTMAVTSLPIDVAKTRIQNWTSSAKPPGVISMLINTAQKEGLLSMWRGFLPYYSRAAPNSIVTMISLDQLRHMYIKYCISPE